MTYKVNLKIIDKGENTDKDILLNNPSLQNKFIRPAYGFQEGCCFNYALNEYYLGCCNNAYSYIVNNYKKIPILQARKGDIVVYFDDYKEISHFAKIEETNGTIKGTTITSKWGKLGIYKTNIYELPTCYGNKCKCEIWNKGK